MSIEQLAETACAMVALQGHQCHRRILRHLQEALRWRGASSALEENRCAYRELLLTAPNANQYLSGAILFDENPAPVHPGRRAVRPVHAATTA